MFVEQKFYVGLSDINNLKELTNSKLLSYLENIACIHSEMAGYGITNMDEVKRTWILLSWKVNVIKRPRIHDILIVKTWSRCIEKFYAFRDFKIYNQKDELVAIATSKWLFIDTEKEKIIKVTDEIASKYETENESVFEEEDLEKIEEPTTSINTIEYKITRNMIDVNKHLHNIYYLDIAKEVLPEEIGLSAELNNFEVMYKKEIKLGETVKAIYTYENNSHYVIIKNKDEAVLHAIIKYSN